MAGSKYVIIAFALFLAGTVRVRIISWAALTADAISANYAGRVCGRVFAGKLFLVRAGGGIFMGQL